MQPFVFQLIECPSIYELMPCPDFHWENPPLLEVWREKTSVNGNSTVMLESFSPVEAVPIFTEALTCNMVSYYRLFLHTD